VPARFYAPLVSAAGAPVALPEEEAHHLAHVMRLGVGRVVHVFDGRGHEYRAEVVEVSKHGVVVRPGDPVQPAPEGPLRLVLAQAILKGDHMDAVIRDATMMGVTAVRPLQTDHVTVPARAIAGTRLAARWTRSAVGSAKQCGRAVVPDVERPARVADVLRGGVTTLMLVEPRHASSLDGDVSELVRRGDDLVLMAGPEGGWSDAELALADRSGVSRWSLGPRTLRADSAALVALSVLTYLAGGAAGRVAPDRPIPG
jgi:16S rRNA (uracil1498-N3)-methyltransferase